VDRVPLTVTLLQERLSAPVLKEGMTTIDLANLVIDIRDENKELQEQFYQQIQGQINRAKQPLGLDFSNSLIQGNFIASRLGLPTPLTKWLSLPYYHPRKKVITTGRKFFIR